MYIDTVFVADALFMALNKKEQKTVLQQHRGGGGGQRGFKVVENGSYVHVGSILS